MIEIDISARDNIDAIKLSAEDWRKVGINDRQGFVPAVYVKKFEVESLLSATSDKSQPSSSMSGTIILKIIGFFWLSKLYG